MKKLSQWIIKKCIKQNKMAAALGISPPTLNRIVSGIMPSLEIAYAIEIFTEGDITVYDFIDENKLSNTKTATKRNVRIK